jgi:prepilin-type processing-associated H-X9-DG protein
VQNKFETPPEQPKVGSTTDYFVVEGVNPAVAADLGFTPTGDLRGVMRTFTEGNTRIVAVGDGTSNTVLFGECAGREDVYRQGRMVAPAQTNTGLPNVARARGGAWATNDNPFEIGGRTPWNLTNPLIGTAIPGPMKINNSNEWGHCYYSFHTGGANFAFADGSVRFQPDGTPLTTLVYQATRNGGEVIPN